MTNTITNNNTSFVDINELITFVVIITRMIEEKLLYHNSIVSNTMLIKTKN